LTTIAYRNGVLAGDSCWAADSLVDTLSKKIVRLKSGALLGEAGDFDTRHMHKLLNTIKRYEDLPTLKELQEINLTYLGLLILPDGTIVKIETVAQASTNSKTRRKGVEEDSAGLYIVEDKFTAIGSGKELALGAMEMGATARQAVMVACKRDINSRPPVWTLSLPKKGK